MSRPAVRHAPKNYWKNTWQNRMCDNRRQPTCMQSARSTETQMPLDHDLLSTSQARCPQDQSRSKGQYPSVHRAASAERLLSPAENSLFACVYIALRCSHCGELRQALGALPQSDDVACPVCSRSCSFVPLGSGLTKKTLPFHEIHTAEQTRWDRWSAEKNDST